MPQPSQVILLFRSWWTGSEENIWPWPSFSPRQIEDDESWWENVDLTKLILASNQLTRISGEIKNLQSLTVLDLHDNSLEELPEEIGLLENLSK